MSLSAGFFWGDMRRAIVIRGCMESGDILISEFRYPHVGTAASVGLSYAYLHGQEFWALLAFSSIEYLVSFCDILSVVC
jgi:hypothetical protein